MDIKQYGKKMGQLLKKYKYAVVVLAIGLALMLLPSGSKAPKETEMETVPATPSVEERLSGILSQVKGAGRVKVMLTVEKGEETVFQTDASNTTGENSNSVKTDTITVDDNGLVRQVLPPVYKGAVVLCQGADDPQIKLSIVDAVSKVTGLGADKISVLKMN